MRRLSSLGLAVLALGLVLVPAALAANPDINHFRNVGTDSDPDFCGTGKTVDIAFDVRGTEWFAPNQQNTVYRNVTQGTVWFTNPLNGKSVLNRFAGPFAITVSGDPNGLHFEDFTNRGLPEQLKLEGRKVILRDAGSSPSATATTATRSWAPRSSSTEARIPRRTATSSCSAR